LDYLALLGRFAEARNTLKIAVELDPLAPIVRESLGYVDILERRFSDAERAYRDLIDFEPLFYKGWTSLGRSLFFQGRYDEAIDAFLRGRALSGDLPTLLAALAQTYALAGRIDNAQTVFSELERMAEERYVPKACYAVVHLGFGDIDKAIDLLKEAYARHELQLAAIGVHPLWDPLRTNAEFQDIVRKIGVAQSSAHS
jgi:tetratricopeptide (TPR) repeat protein